MTEPAIFNFSHPFPPSFPLFFDRLSSKTNKATFIQFPLSFSIPSSSIRAHISASLNILPSSDILFFSTIMQQCIPLPPFFTFSSILLLLFCICCECAIYTPDTFPDSLKDFGQCGLDHPGFVCDPDGFLNPGPDGTKGIELLNRMLQNIRANTECICENDTLPSNSEPTQNAVANSQQSSPTQNAPLFGQCEKEPNKHGFTVSVAILGKMAVTDEQKRRYREYIHMPAIFAAELKKYQNRGQCNDEALIVLAVNDSSIRTSTGGMIATKLNSQLILNVSRIAQKFFARRDYTSGLLHMLDEFAEYLGAEPRPKPEPNWWDTYFWTFFPQFWRQSEWRWFFLIGLLILIVLLIVAIVFGLRRLEANRNSAGYSAGVERGRTKA